MSAKVRPDHLPEVRFFASYTPDMGFYGSAILHFVYAWIPKKVKDNDIEPWEFAFYTNYSDIGLAVGCSAIQARRLVIKLEEAKLITHVQGRRRIWIKLRNQTVYNRIAHWYALKSQGDWGDEPMEIYHYNRAESLIVGVVQTLIYNTIKWHTVEPISGMEGYKAGPARFVKKFPFLTEGAVRRALYRLKETGLIMWDTTAGCYFGAHRYMSTGRPMYAGHDPLKMPAEIPDNLLLINFNRKMAAGAG